MLLLIASILLGFSVGYVMYSVIRAINTASGFDSVIVSDKFPENIKIYQLTAIRLIRSRINLIPSKMERELERLWSKSGRLPKELIFFKVKLEIIALSAIIISTIILVSTGSLGFALFVSLPVVLFWALIYYQFKDFVAERIEQIERELPYILDLLSVMLYGGGNVFQALHSLTNIAMKTPLIDELRSVASTHRMGRRFSDALAEFADRIGSDNVKSVVLSVQQGERLGTPLHQVLKAQSRTIRNKRILTAEENAQAAGVKVFVPASLVMLALMILLLAPSIMKMFSSM